MSTFITTVVIRHNYDYDGLRNNSAFKVAIWGTKVCLTFNPKVMSDTASSPFDRAVSIILAKPFYCIVGIVRGQ